MSDLLNTTELSRPSTAATWGYSLLFVTLINLCSLLGAVVIPCMKIKIYKLILMFMVALAVGTLSGSGLFFLIPEALMLTQEGNDGSYVWKCATIMGGIYLFYLTENIMRMINARKQNARAKKQLDELAAQDAITATFRQIPIDNSVADKDPTKMSENIENVFNSHCLTHNHHHHSNSSNDFASQDTLQTEDSGVDSVVDISVFRSQPGDMNVVSSETKKAVGNKQSYKLNHHKERQATPIIATVAYMIVFGDALHNFIDGLSIGSAFTQSTLSGVSVCVAVICEELPHELGDFAVLLNSGMSFKRAMLFNFLSSCTCYLGTITGIVLGENTSSHEWVFGVAGGMFLYISLADMMPEMNAVTETEEGKEFGERNTFLLQNCGLLTGFAIMLVFALYGSNIDFK